ncbi:MAG: hypothetical protein EHM91_05470 [Planctomycetota bacterium]|nr:MAG: hypothetical protein EHM91_05470 [Planctomycetota bacterium]
MRKLALVVLPILALAAVLLTLNLREADRYEFGSLTPPGRGSNVAADDFAIQRVFPDLRFTHVCAGCGECVHPFEIVENRRALSMRDYDGWYKAFWAADEEYSYSDPVHLMADWANNRTAETPRGTWRIRLRAGSATHRHAPTHECGRIPLEIALAYQLVASENPLDETYHSGDGPLKILETFSWIVTTPEKPMALGWRLVDAPTVVTAACPCAIR